MYRLFLSLRFLRHHWLMTLIGSFFVGASLVILVVVMAVMDGFQHRLRETYSGSSADLTVTPLYPADLGALEQLVLSNVVEAQAGSPHHETISLVRREGKLGRLEEEFHFAFVFGVDGVKEGRINRWVENLRLKPQKHDLPPDAAPDEDAGPEEPLGFSVEDIQQPFLVHDEMERATGTRGVILGRSLMKAVGVRVGDKVKLFALVPKKGAENGGESEDDYELRQDLFLVVGIFETGNSEIDDRCVFLDHREFGQFFSAASSRSSVRFRLDSPDDYESAQESIRNHLNGIVRGSTLPGARPAGGLTVTTWTKKHKTLVQAIQSEKQMILVIAFLIVVAGASSIFAAQWLLVSDKVREIGILRSLGASVGGVTSIFVINGLLMGVIGSVGGSLVGLLTVHWIDHVHAVLSKILGHEVFNADIYLFKTIPTQVDYEQVTQYAVAALVCTLIASAIPALRAGLMDPAGALRRD